MVGPDPAAGFVKLTSAGGRYFTVVRVRDLEHPRAVLAVAAGGEELGVEYGGPVRAVFPQLWGYKSAKSIVSVEFTDRDEPGYWERRGYDGDAGITATKLFDLNSRQSRHHGGGEVTW
jgi:DMSO/TMAO reductase YedYZ molybdopterin-dependent catalytic subunit